MTYCLLMCFSIKRNTAQRSTTTGCRCLPATWGRSTPTTPGTTHLKVRGDTLPPGCSSLGGESSSDLERNEWLQGPLGWGMGQGESSHPGSEAGADLTFQLCYLLVVTLRKLYKFWIPLSFFFFLFSHLQTPSGELLCLEVKFPTLYCSEN